jgi:peptidoglycan/xylan/chitin deacetylase (PgdA/CDA1 family)
MIFRWQISLLRRWGYSFVTVTEGVKGGCKKNTCAITFDDGYMDNWALGLPLLKQLNVSATVFVVTRDIGKTSNIWPESGEKLPSDLMDWKHLRQLEDAGWEIGSHASEHIHLARKTPDEQRRIIEASWDDFLAHLGKHPTSFAYPYGSFSTSTVQILEDLNCKAAVTTDSSGVNTSTTPPLLLYRKPSRGYGWQHYVTSLSLLW